MIQALKQTYDLKDIFSEPVRNSGAGRASNLTSASHSPLPSLSGSSPVQETCAGLVCPGGFAPTPPGLFYVPCPMGYASHAASVSWACVTPVPFSAENNCAVARSHSVAAAARSTAAASPRLSLSALESST